MARLCRDLHVVSSIFPEVIILEVEIGTNDTVSLRPEVKNKGVGVPTSVNLFWGVIGVCEVIPPVKI